MGRALKQSLKQYWAWLWKEWRDQRAVTVGIFVAIPALTALAYWTFGNRIGVSRLENVRPIFLAVAVGLVVFAVAGDLFAGENRRKTIHALRRLPGGMRAAFAAKLTFLAVLMIAVVGLQGVSLAVAENLNAERMAKIGISDYHFNGAGRSLALFEELGRFPTSTLWLTGLCFGVLGLWTLLVSSWMPRSGISGVGAIVLLAALATPFFLFFREHPWFFPGPLMLASWTAGIAAIVAAGATGLSFLRGQRFAGRPFRPVLLGAAVLLACLGGGYAYAQKSLADWLEIEPTDEEFRIWEARMGAGGKHLFLTVHRGRAWNGGRPTGHHARGQDPWRSRRGSPLQAWVVDLEIGTHEPIDGRAERYFNPVPEVSGVTLPWPMDPVEALVAYRITRDQVSAISWWDARAGEQVRTLPGRVRDASTLDLVRRCLRTNTWLRDAQGRRVWMRDGTYEREGQAFEPVNGVVVRTQRLRSAQPVPGGWFGMRFDGKGTIAEWLVVDAETGAEKVVPRRKNGMPWYGRALSTEHTFAMKPRRKHDRNHRAAQVVARFDDPENFLEPRNEPESISSPIGRDLALALRGEKHAFTLHAWNPVTGEDRPLRWTGSPLEGISEASAHGRTGDGRILLYVVRRRPHTQCAYVLLHADLEHLSVLRGWSPSTRTHDEGPVALMPDNSLIMLQRRKRVVVYRFGGGMKVLFPRRQGGEQGQE